MNYSRSENQVRKNTLGPIQFVKSIWLLHSCCNHY